MNFEKLLLNFCLTIATGFLVAQPAQPVELVYPHLDAANSRWFYFSAACRPFGMVNLSPDTELGGAWGSGYRYDTEEIKGFSHIHAWQLGGVSVMPISSKQGLKDLTQDYYSPFTHEKETVQPGYHKVYLERYQTTVELTSTTRVGFHRYTFPEEEDKGIIVNLGGRLGPAEMVDGHIEKVSSKSYQGYTVNGTTKRRPKETTVYYYIELNTKAKLKSFTEDKIGLLQLRKDSAQVLMKVGISYVSEQQAKLNLETELPHWNFDRVVKESKEEWNILLSRIKVSGGSKQARIRFYTDLWHALQGRRIVSDVNGKYLDNTGDQPRIGQIPLDDNGKPLFNHHNSDSFWGAQWTIQTLWHLVYPERSSDFCRSLLTYYNDGGLIPRGPSGGNYTYVMTGASSTPFIVSAWMKGIRDFDIGAAYQGLKKNHMPSGIMAHAGYEHKSAKGGGLEYYINQGYVPYPLPEKVDAFHTDGAGQTLEYAYQDHCLAQLADHLDKVDDHTYFTQRSMNYQNLYDTTSGFMRPKTVDGKWRKNYDPYAFKKGFVESNGAQMTWYVPHDYQGLAELMGGSRQLIEKLNSEFEKAQQQGFTSGKAHAHETRFDARRIPINYGNQPSIQTAYIFNEVGAPWLTQKWSRLIVDSVYSGISPRTGFNGDEDQGLMGSLSVLMKIGLFQLDGCLEDPKYQIGSPIFDEIKIQLSDEYYSGKTLHIVTQNNSPENIYVQSMLFNGRLLDRHYLYHSELIEGGYLQLVMGDQPNLQNAGK